MHTCSDYIYIFASLLHKLFTLHLYIFHQYCIPVYQSIIFYIIFIYLYNISLLKWFMSIVGRNLNLSYSKYCLTGGTQFYSVLYMEKFYLETPWTLKKKHFPRRNHVRILSYLLLVSFFWLVGVVAQLTLTSCKRDSCRERGRGQRWEANHAWRREEGAFSLIRGFVTHQFYFILWLRTKVVSVCHTLFLNHHYKLIYPLLWSNFTYLCINLKKNSKTQWRI